MARKRVRAARAGRCARAETRAGALKCGLQGPLGSRAARRGQAIPRFCCARRLARPATRGPHGQARARRAKRAPERCNAGYKGIGSRAARRGQSPHALSPRASVRARQRAAFPPKHRARRESHPTPPVSTFDKPKCHKSHFDNGYMLAYTGRAGYNTVNAEAVAR